MAKSKVADKWMRSQRFGKFCFDLARNPAYNYIDLEKDLTIDKKTAQWCLDLAVLWAENLVTPCLNFWPTELWSNNNLLLYATGVVHTQQYKTDTIP